jgi:hypothetical protein
MLVTKVLYSVLAEVSQVITADLQRSKQKDKAESNLSFGIPRQAPDYNSLDLTL